MAKTDEVNRRWRSWSHSRWGSSAPPPGRHRLICRYTASFTIYPSLFLPHIFPDATAIAESCCCKSICYLTMGEKRDGDIWDESKMRILCLQVLTPLSLPLLFVGLIIYVCLFCLCRLILIDAHAVFDEKPNRLWGKLILSLLICTNTVCLCILFLSLPTTCSMKVQGAYCNYFFMLFWYFGWADMNNQRWVFSHLT
jgi:hypothetical protein